MEYNQYHYQLLVSLFEQIQQMAPFNSDNFSEQDHAFAHNFKQLITMEKDEAFFGLGQQLICQIVAAYPHITPKIPRDLLWYFSGDCMHFLNDEEIDLYSQLDDMRFEAEQAGQDFNMVEARANLKKLH